MRPSGYHCEHTVVTPGSEDRGTRRLVEERAGEPAGERARSDDRYAPYGSTHDASSR